MSGIEAGNEGKQGGRQVIRAAAGVNHVSDFLDVSVVVHMVREPGRLQSGLWRGLET